MRVLVQRRPLQTWPLFQTWQLFYEYMSTKYKGHLFRLGPWSRFQAWPLFCKNRTKATLQAWPLLAKIVQRPPFYWLGHLFHDHTRPPYKLGHLNKNRITLATFLLTWPPFAKIAQHWPPFYWLGHLLWNRRTLATFLLTWPPFAKFAQHWPPFYWLGHLLSNWAKAKTRLEWFRYKTGSKHETAKTSAKQSYSFRNGAFAWFLPNGALSNFCRTMSRTLRRSSLWISE